MLTKPQAAALAQLKDNAANFAPVSRKGITAPVIKTGVNVTVLANLKRAGYITFSQVFIGGWVDAKTFRILK